MTYIYCVKCRNKTDSTNEQIVSFYTKNNIKRFRKTGKCKICGSKKSQFIKQKEQSQINKKKRRNSRNKQKNKICKKKYKKESNSNSDIIDDIEYYLKSNNIEFKFKNHIYYLEGDYYKITDFLDYIIEDFKFKDAGCYYETDENGNDYKITDFCLTEYNFDDDYDDDEIISFGIRE